MCRGRWKDFAGLEGSEGSDLGMPLRAGRSARDDAAPLFLAALRRDFDGVPAEQAAAIAVEISAERRQEEGGGVVTRGAASAERHSEV